jgi:hypothetical protein
MRVPRHCPRRLQDWLNDATHWVSYLTTDAQLGRRFVQGEKESRAG